MTVRVSSEDAGAGVRVGTVAGTARWLLLLASPECRGSSRWQGMPVSPRSPGALLHAVKGMQEHLLGPGLGLEGCTQEAQGQ